MASIFLSYARDDAARAKALATVLERAGHKVWWDRHISGGSEYSDEIEAALKDADVVLVLWSRASVRSAWVRDEAAEGRDSGRLVPVLLDDSAPPLGFRQVQSISVAGWSARGNPPNWQELLKAVAARAGVSGADAEPATDARPRRRPIVIAGIALLAALLIAAGAWFMLGGRSPASATPVLAVLPFADLSPQGDKAYLAEGVAEAILTGLAKDPGIKVIGRSSARQLHDAGGAAPDMRRAMGITHVLEGSARSIGDQLRMSVRLINAADGQQVWAEEYSRKLDNIFAVQDEIGRAVAEKLKGSFGPARSATPITQADVYALYLAARSKMRDRRTSSLDEALKLVRRVMKADPNYAPGHAAYAELIRHLSSDSYGTLPTEQWKPIAERHARRAIALAPKSADGYAALGISLSNAEAIAPLQTAIRLDPGRAEVKHWLGHALNDVGRHEEALKQFHSVLEMEPVWGPAISMVAYTFAASERYDEAEAALVDFERRGGKPALANKIRGDLANYRGDYSEAVRLTELALKQDPEIPQANQSAGWYYFLLGMPDESVRVAGGMPRYTRLLFAGQQDRLRSEARAAGDELWKQPDYDIAIESLAIGRDWNSIVALYDANPAIQSAICSRAEQLDLGLTVAAALKAERRAKESADLLACARAHLTRHGRGKIRTPFLPASNMDLNWAQVRAIEGRGAPVLPLLNRSIDRGIRTSYGLGLDQLPHFDGLKAHPDYAKIDARLKQLMARDRAETLAWKRRAD